MRHARVFGLLAACLSAGVISVFAQNQGGTVNFANDSSCRILNGISGAPVRAADNFEVALFCAPTNSNSFTQVGDAVTAGWPVPGIFAGGTRTASGLVAPGATARFQVRVWPKSFSTFDDAIFHGAPVGVSAIVLMPTGNADALPAAPPPSLVPNGLQGFTIRPNHPPISCVDGQTEIWFTGGPGQCYVIQYAPSINGPWCNLSDPIIVGPSGQFGCNDQQERSATRFYRAVLHQ